MATHSSILAWRIPGMEEPVGCRLCGRTESDTTDAAQQQQIKERNINQDLHHTLKIYNHFMFSTNIFD